MAVRLAELQAKRDAILRARETTKAEVERHATELSSCRTDVERSLDEREVAAYEARAHLQSMDPRAVNSAARAVVAAAVAEAERQGESSGEDLIDADTPEGAALRHARHGRGAAWRPADGRPVVVEVTDAVDDPCVPRYHGDDPVLRAAEAERLREALWVRKEAARAARGGASSSDSEIDSVT